jgi:hypothetical protein
MILNNLSDSTCIDDVVKKYVNGAPPADAGNDEADVECDIDGTPFGMSTLELWGLE